MCGRIAVDPKAGDRFGFILWMSARDVDLTTFGYVGELPEEVLVGMRQVIATLAHVAR